MSLLPSFVNEENIRSPHLTCATEIFRHSSSRGNPSIEKVRAFSLSLVDIGLYKLKDYLSTGDFRNAEQLAVCAAVVEECKWLEPDLRDLIAETLRRLIIDPTAVHVASAVVAAALVARTRQTSDYMAKKLDEISEELFCLAEAQTKFAKTGR